MNMGDLIGEHLSGLTKRLLETASSNERFFVLGGSSQSIDNVPNKPFLCGWGMLDSVQINRRADLKNLDTFLKKYPGKWIFGHCCYEAGFLLEPHFEEQAVEPDSFSIASFFLPRYVAEPTAAGYRIWDQAQEKTVDPEEVLTETTKSNSAQTPVSLQDPPSRAAYIDTVRHLIQHLKRGDIYEINYCIPFRAAGHLENPLQTWINLHARQQTPFGALYREGKNWLLCGSPERFMRKDGMKLKSEPIKGTAPRGATPEQDALNREALQQSEKERAENVMIVDLVRNDLGRLSEPGSVKVDELCGIYTFPGLHQMISTISGTLRPDVGFKAILEALFPMGSMTGAPKIRAMELIQQHECFSRGLYSGTIGIVKPNGDFDFNVVIRSILYNEELDRLTMPVGSAITANCNPESEYEECLLKAKGMLEAISG